MSPEPKKMMSQLCLARNLLTAEFPEGRGLDCGDTCWVLGCGCDCHRPEPKPAMHPDPTQTPNSPRIASHAAENATVKRVDLFGTVVDTFQTEGELNGWHATQAQLFALAPPPMPTPANQGGLI